MSIRLVASDAATLRLRPPCARPTVIVHRFEREMYSNPGFTVRFPSISEPVIAMADGRVTRVEVGSPSWRSSSAPLNTYSVTIDHGYGVETFVAGLAKAEVRQGASVYRGQRLGLPLTLEVFYQVRQGGGSKNPSDTSRHFAIYDQRFVKGLEAQSVRFAPDVASGRDLSATAVPTSAYLVNVDFAGDGRKRGRAAAGYGDDDYWNLYTPSSFSTTIDHVCGEGFIYSSTPTVPLDDWFGRSTPAWIEKKTEAPLNFSGSVPSWDPMLSGWVGGYDRFVPLETYFVVRGLPTTPLRLFFYSSLGLTSFFISVDGGHGIVQNSTYSAGPAQFVKGVNYVEFSPVTLKGGKTSSLGVKVLGYLAGMQILRA